MMNKIRKIYPFIYGIFGSLGFLCCTNIFLDFDYKISEHPYAHPFSLIAGSLSLIICVAVFCLDIVSLIKEERKFRYILKTLLITVISFFIDTFIWSGLWRFVSDFIKGW
ncbi:MAG: hypothetical protein K2L10_02535 [Ruminococcus sp.]|nr:hypothetical protein [Ruminococcus sp.]